VIDDTDDDHVLAYAAAAQTDLIESGDAHLLDLKRYHGLRIVAAVEALAIVEREYPALHHYARSSGRGPEFALQIIQ
jgi:predicted nucleic acid-binding protein